MFLNWFTDAWNEMIKFSNNVINWLLGVLFLIIAILMFVRVIKGKSPNTLELCLWILWIYIGGINFIIHFDLKNIFQPSTYISLGLAFFAVTRIIYLLSHLEKGSHKKSK
jgi:hypothetical protein